MALATRCPNCQTTFRVVQDQLKLYSGIVRCGVCQQVFNGADHLVEEDSSPAVSSEAPVDNPPAPDSRRPASADSGADSTSASAGNPAPSLGETSATKPNPQAHADSTADDEFAPTELKIDDYADFDVFEEPASQEELPPISLDLGDGKHDFAPAHHEIDVATRDFDPFEIEEPCPDESQKKTGSLAKPDIPDLPVWSDTLSRSEADNKPGEARESDESKPIKPTRPIESDERIEEPRMPGVVSEPEPGMPIEQHVINQTAIDAYLSEPGATESAAGELPANTPHPAAPAPSAEPEFVKKAKTRQKSRRISHVMLSLCSLLLTAVLVLQAIYVFHYQIVARMPWAEPAVREICAVLGCDTRVSANIDELSLESTELLSLPDQPNAFALDILLRNRSASPQAWPSLEVTLNNESGQPAVRRVLSPDEYLHGMPQAAAIEKGLAGQSEQTIKLTFTLEQAKAAGYRVYLFYP